VENDATRARLVHLGCPAAQGYLFSRPIPSSQLIEWLAQRPAQEPDGVVVTFDVTRGAARIS